MVDERVLGTIVEVSEKPGRCRVGRGIFDGIARDDGLEFRTKYEIMTSSSGGSSTTQPHSKHYFATLKDNVLEIVMQDDQGYPLRTFIAHKQPAEAFTLPE